MRARITLLFLSIASLVFSQETILMPSSDFFKRESMMHGSNLPSSFPASYEIMPKGVEYFEKFQRDRNTWLGRKIYQEHFIQKKREDFYLTVDPVLDVSIGKDLVDENLSYIYQNTRGIQVDGEILNQLSFHTEYYENQSVFAGYLSDAYASRGEQKLKNGSYIKEHAVIPAGARTKPFGDNGYDYGFSAAYVRWKQSKYLQLQLGSSPEFIGYGKRSLLLSDFAPPSTQLKISSQFAEKWNYSFQIGKSVNFFRRKYFTTVEAPFERKGRSMHLLSYQPTKKINISFFQSGMWFSEDSVKSQSLPAEFYAPIPLLNPLVHGFEDDQVKHLIGVNFGVKLLKSYLLYGQIVTDDIKSNQYGIQFGARASYLFGKQQIDLLAEWNKTSNNLYQADNVRLAYSNANLPLAYALGNGTNEIVGEVSYAYRNFILTGFVSMYTNKGYANSLNGVFEEKSNADIETQHTSIFTRAELAYRFNAKTNLRVFASAIYRVDKQSGINAKIVQFGLKSGLRNKHHNY